MVKNIATTSVIIIATITLLACLSYYYTNYKKTMTDKHLLLIADEIDGTDSGSNTKFTSKSLNTNTNSNNFTFTMWLLFNPNNKGKGSYHILSRTAPTTATHSTFDISLTKYNSIKIQCPTSHSTLTPLTVKNIPLGLWISLAVIVDGRVVNIYINGQLSKSYILPAPPIIPTGSIYVAGNLPGTIKKGNGFAGKMTQLRFFPRTLNSKEVKTIYNMGKNPIYSPISSAEEVITGISTTIDSGIDSIEDMFKPIEKAGEDFKDKFKNTYLYDELSSMGTDVDKLLGKGLTAVGGYLDTEGKELIYGKKWDENPDYLLNDKKLLNEACNTPAFAPYPYFNDKRYTRMVGECGYGVTGTGTTMTLSPPCTALSLSVKKAKSAYTEAAAKYTAAAAAYSKATPSDLAAYNTAADKLQSTSAEKQINQDAYISAYSKLNNSCLSEAQIKCNNDTKQCAGYFIDNDGAISQITKDPTSDGMTCSNGADSTDPVQPQSYIQSGVFDHCNGAHPIFKQNTATPYGDMCVLKKNITTSPSKLKINDYGCPQNCFKVNDDMKCAQYSADGKTNIQCRPNQSIELSTHYNSDPECESDCDCFYTSTCVDNKCSPLVYDNKTDASIHYKEITDRVAAHVVPQNASNCSAADLSKSDIGPDYCNYKAYLESANNKYPVVPANTINPNRQICQQQCDVAKNCYGYLHYSLPPNSAACNEGDCIEQNKCLLFSENIDKLQLPHGGLSNGKLFRKLSKQGVASNKMYNPLLTNTLDISNYLQQS